MAEFRYATPVTSFMQGAQFRMNQDKSNLQMQGERQRQDMAASQEQRAQQSEQRAQESHEMNQKMKEFELKMSQDKKARTEVIQKTNDIAQSLLSILESPEEKQAELFQQIYPHLDKDSMEKMFPDGQWDPTRAMVGVRSSLSVLDRLKMIHQEQLAKEKSKSALTMQQQKDKTKKEIENKKQEGKSATVKAADENAIASRAALLFGGMYDPTTGLFSGLSKDQRQKALAIGARGSELFRTGKAKDRNQAAAMAAREMGIDVQHSAQQNKPPISVKDWATQLRGQ